MGDEVREYVRAAQEAELRGDLPGAVELLIKSATLYRSMGRPNRALTMLKQAKRLAPARTELDEEIQRLEWLPGPTLGAALSPIASLDSEMRRILGELGSETRAEEVPTPAPPGEALPGDPSRELVERGPQRADPGVDAWCSFCCRPKRETGPLVAGPAGAFVCGGCTTQVLGLLAPDRAGELIGSGAVAPAPRPVPPGDIELAAQTRALRELGRLFEWGRTRILLLGPDGAGKSVVLRRFAQDAGMRVLSSPDVAAELPVDAPVLLDCAETTGPSLAPLLSTHSGPVIVAMRGNAPRSISLVVTDGGTVGIPSTSALVEATAGALPPEVLERFDGVVALPALAVEALEELASALLLRQGQTGELVRELAPVLAREAHASGRGAHELIALLRRVPRGGRRVEHSPKSVRSGRRRTKKSEDR